MRSFPTLLALLIVAPSAHALQPETSVHVGIEPHRVFPEHTREQDRLALDSAWQDFVQANPGWQARFDEATGAPWRMWGAPIPMPTGSKEELANALIALFESHPDVFRVEPGKIQLRGASYNERVDSWYVDFDAPIDGIPVYRGGLTARIKNGNLVMLGSLTYRDEPTEGTWALTWQQAIDRAVAMGPASNVPHTEQTAEQIWLPIQDSQGLRLRATWKTYSRTTAIPGKWVSFVDAQTGELLSVHNEVRFLDGNVSGWHAARTVDGSPLVRSAFPNAIVSDGVNVAVTDANGNFSLPDSTEYVTTLSGDYLSVRNMAGPEAELIDRGPDFEWSVEVATQAEVSSYAFLSEVREWGLGVAPEVGMVRGPIRSNVNITDQSCNAFFDGEVNFFAAADGCANTGEIADVEFHEWGHGFHMHSIESQFTGFDGSLSEGAADTVAFLHTGDSEIAPHFFNNGGSIRDVGPDRVYPDDYTNSEDAVHSNGLIFGGAMWDLWHLLVDVEGVEQGSASTEAIFSGLLKAGPDIASSYDEALFADDDDGNLANGTPHECELIEAFGRHGLGPLGGQGVYRTTFQPPLFHAEATPFEVALDVESSAPNCFAIDPTGGAIRYRTNRKGEWKTAGMTATGNRITGQLPDLEPGTFVEYYAEVNDASGADLVLPAGGEINPYSVYIGDVLEVSCSKFEHSNGRFKHDLVSGAESEGADDWQWGAPNGQGGDPVGAFSGDNVWGNDLGYDGFNGQYQDDKKNRLRSPTLDTGHYMGTFLSYQRWLTIEDGVFDRAEIVADGEVVWSNVKGLPDQGGKNHIDREWTPQAIDLGDAGDDRSIDLSFTLESDGGLTFGGWNIDDVCIFAPNTADNRLGIDHLVAKRTEDGVKLSWTNPLHDPVRTVYVLRNYEHAPSGPTDGTVIWLDDDVEIGAANGFFDGSVGKWDAHYAVFATDDDHILSWAREGFNVAFAEGDGAAPPRVSGEAGGCGCDHTAPTGGWLGLVGLTLLGLRRRE